MASAFPGPAAGGRGLRSRAESDGEALLRRKDRNFEASPLGADDVFRTDMIEIHCTPEHGIYHNGQQLTQK